MDAIRQEKIEENFYRTSNLMKKFDDDIFNLKYKMFPLGTSEQKTKTSKEPLMTLPTV